MLIGFSRCNTLFVVMLPGLECISAPLDTRKESIKTIPVGSTHTRTFNHISYFLCFQSQVRMGGRTLVAKNEIGVGYTQINFFNKVQVGDGIFHLHLRCVTATD